MSERIIDMHSHWATERGYALQSAEERALQRATFNSDPAFVTEDEMAAHLRERNVSAMLDLGHRQPRPTAEVRDLHDYAFAVQRAHPDVILGHWLHIDLELGDEGVAEFRRCLEVAPGLVGICVSGPTMGAAPTDPRWRPYYELSIEANVPALVLVGHTMAGAQQPGGAGMILDHAHPRHVDAVAAAYPDLTVIAGRPAWPWQSELISIMLHKPNVWQELHGWRPKYFPADLKHEISRRLRSRMMFGADYPLLSYERILQDWRDEGYDEGTLTAVFHENAQRLFARLGRSWT